MTQLVTRVDEDLASRVDELVAEGVVESRSDAVRRGLRVLIININGVALRRRSSVATNDNPRPTTTLAGQTRRPSA